MSERQGIPNNVSKGEICPCDELIETDDGRFRCPWCGTIYNDDEVTDE